MFDRLFNKKHLCLADMVKRKVAENRTAIFALVVLLATVVLFVAFPVSANASNEAGGEVKEVILRVRPALIMNYSLGPSKRFDVNLTAVNATNLHGFTMRLSYDATLIHCTNVERGDLLEASGTTTMSFDADNTLGSVYVSSNLTSPEAAANNNGTLVRLTFTVMNTGETILHVYDVNLYDPNGASLSYVVHDGYFNNRFNIDVAMPLTLFAITLVSMFLNQKTEIRLKQSLEERVFRIRDAVLLVGMMAVMIGFVVVVREVSLIMMGLFLLAYSILLFTFGYLFSNNRWYVGIAAPLVFILLYVFFRDTALWAYYLGNIYGVIFAVLITLYLVSLFTWKTTAVFGVLITVMDIVLVLITGTMIEAANAARSLSLPVLVAVPLVPIVATGEGLLLLNLGLGDFFFAGLLAIQTFKRYGRAFAVLTAMAMSVSFFVFEAFMLTYEVRAFPGTLMIICGWIPLVLWKELKRKKIPNTSEKN
jgi:hypothetical protein